MYPENIRLTYIRSRCTVTSEYKRTTSPRSTPMTIPRTRGFLLRPRVSFLESLLARNWTAFEGRQGNLEFSAVARNARALFPGKINFSFYLFLSFSLFPFLRFVLLYSIKVMFVANFLILR